MECKICLMTDELTHIHEDGVCDFCRMHEELDGLDDMEFWEIEHEIRTKDMTVLIGISGGMDSSYLLWYTVKVLRLKVLALHFDNGWNDPSAEHNMELLVKNLGVDFVRVYKDEYYDDLCAALLMAGVVDADIANDMYMADIMQTTAKKYGIKYIFNGHDFRNEGSTPLVWTYMDAKYIQSVYWWWTGRQLKTKHLQTFWKQLRSGTKQVRVFHYINIPEEERVGTMESFGLKKYQGKHGENIYTKWIGYFLLPIKFGVDKRIVYLSAKIRDGQLTKEDARKELHKSVDTVDFDEVIGPVLDLDLESVMAAPKHTYNDFEHYDFKRYKKLIGLMAQMRLVPVTFYKKYAR